MRLLTRSAVVLAVAAAAVAGPPAGAEASDRPDKPGALVVPADGGVVTTPFETRPGLRYVISVSGTFAADRTGTLADCGYRDANGGVLGQDWRPANTGLLVDGTYRWCGPYAATHRYTLAVAGTGAPLAFSIGDATGPGDNAGALTVEVLPDSELRARCHVDAVGAGSAGGGTVLATIVAAAWHEGVPADVVATGVDCRVGWQGSTWQVTWPGPVATFATAHPLDAGVRLTDICVSAWDVRTDGTSRTTGWRCGTQLLEEEQ